MKSIFAHLSDILSLQRMDVAYHNRNVDGQDFVPLSRYVVIKGGKRIPKGESFSSEKTNYLYLRLSEITDHENINYDTLKCISEELFNLLHRYEIRDNQIVFSIAGTIGRVFVMKNIPKEKRIILTENCAMILPRNDAFLSDYISILLNCDFVQKQVEKNRIQTTIPKIGLDRIGKIIIPALPETNLQKQIVEYYNKGRKGHQEKKLQANNELSQIDSIILNELDITLPPKIEHKTVQKFHVKISKLINNRIDPYFHEYYFYKAFDVLRKSPNTKYLREIAELITSGTTPKSGGKDYTSPENGIAFIRSGDIDINGDIDFSNILYITPKIHKTTMKSSQLRRNDIMIAIVGATIGQVGIYLSDREANINQAIAIVRLKDGVNPEYIKEVLQSSIGQLSLDRLKRPVARANINLEEIGSILIPIPDIEKQNEIVKKVKDVRLRAKQLQEEGVRQMEKVKQEIENIILDNNGKVRRNNLQSIR